MREEQREGEREMERPWPLLKAYEVHGEWRAVTLLCHAIPQYHSRGLLGSGQVSDPPRTEENAKLGGVAIAGTWWTTVGCPHIGFHTVTHASLLQIYKPGVSDQVVDRGCCQHTSCDTAVFGTQPSTQIVMSTIAVGFF